MKKLFLVLAAYGLVACNSSQPTEVLVLPTLHGAHELNPNYTYKDLMQIAEDFEPDVIGVEIRPEDMQMQSDSLDVFYPIEMIMIRDSFPHVRGIDFYSEDTRNKKVSKNIFADSTSEMGRIKILASSMAADSVLIKEEQKVGIPKIQEEQKRIVLNYSAEQFLKEEYDSLTALQYRLEDSIYEGSKYEGYSRFNNRRDAQITQNAMQLIEENPEKRVLILVGANHRNRLVDSLTNMEKIKLIPDLGFMQRK